MDFEREAIGENRKGMALLENQAEYGVCTWGVGGNRLTVRILQEFPTFRPVLQFSAHKLSVLPIVY